VWETGKRLTTKFEISCGIRLNMCGLRDNSVSCQNQAGKSGGLLVFVGSSNPVAILLDNPGKKSVN
jgi:hypothetical protein